jgi:hypothetical protein
LHRYEERQLQLEAADKKETEEEEAEELDEVDIECAVCFDPFGDDERVTGRYCRKGRRYLTEHVPSS